MIPPSISATALGDPRIAHAFFTRQGGVSQGIYATLNGGTGSRDAPAAVAANRARMTAALGADELLVPYLLHSAEARAVEAPFGEPERPRCDALVTRTPGLALGVTGADCGMILFADVEAGVVGAAHAGWRGALGGILEATVAVMEGIGARRSAIAAVIGPTIRQGSYAVGPEFRARFEAADTGYGRFFAPLRGSGQDGFDLPGFIAARLESAGVGTIHDLALDTYADEVRFFSFRRATHRGEADYGRLVSAIALRRDERG